MKTVSTLIFCFCLSSAVAYGLTDSFLKMVSTGGPRSLEEALQILPQASGDEAKDLTAALGKSIVKSPKSFLKAVKKHNLPQKQLEDVVASYEGEAANKDKQSMQKEALLRIESLKSVDDKELKAVRDECIASLEKKINQVTQQN
jgi:hypothetical protein